MEETFVMLKPEALQRGLVGKLITRLEEKGLKLTMMVLHNLTLGQAEQLYRGLEDWQGYKGYIQHITSSPSVLMVWEGRDAVNVVRKLIGSAKDPGPETLRGQYAIDPQRNLIHASDSLETARRDVQQWQRYQYSWERHCGSMIDHEEAGK